MITVSGSYRPRTPVVSWLEIDNNKVQILILRNPSLDGNYALASDLPEDVREGLLNWLNPRKETTND